MIHQRCCVRLLSTKSRKSNLPAQQNRLKIRPAEESKIDVNHLQALRLALVRNCHDFKTKHADDESSGLNYLDASASRRVVSYTLKNVLAATGGSDLYIADGGPLRLVAEFFGIAKDYLDKQGARVLDRIVLFKTAPDGDDTCLSDDDGQPNTNITVHPEPVDLAKLFRLARRGQQSGGGAGPPSPLYRLDQLYSPHRTPDDPFSLVAVGDVDLIRQMTLHAVNSSDADPSRTCRPDMYLVLTPRALIEICGGYPKLPAIVDNRWLADLNVVNVPKLRTKFYFFYRMMFDTQLLKEIPAEELLADERPDTMVPAGYRSNLMLVHSRRKEFPANAHFNLYLPYFVEVLRRQGRGETTRMVTILEAWIDGLGLEMVNLGYPVNTLASEIRMEDMRTLYLKLVSHPNFEDSPFKVGAEIKLKSFADWTGSR